jgi:hypothetical protein
MANGNYAGDADTLQESAEQLEMAGFTGQFGAQEDGMVKCFTCHTSSPAARVELEALRRTEGASDPDDMIAIAAIRCPNCDTAGTLILRFGAESTIEDDEVLRMLEDRRAEQTGGIEPVLDVTEGREEHRAAHHFGH